MLVLLLYLVVLMFAPRVALGDGAPALALAPPAPSAPPKAAPSPPPAPAPALSGVGSGSLMLAVEETQGWLSAPIAATEVEITVGGLLARARVIQTFRNPGDRWVEGIYVFPLPEDAAVDHMTMRIGERIVEGRIEERGQARRTYEAARSQGRRAGLIDQERPNIFTASIANIGPGEEVVVAIDYQHVLRYDQGTFRLRFPMVVAPRYLPGRVRVAGLGGGGAVATGGVPDPDRISPPVLHPDVGKINPVRLTVDLDPGFELARIKSPYHPVAVTEGPDGRYRVTLKEGVVPADRDFELAWSPALAAAPRAALFTETAGGTAHLLVMVMPPAPDPTGAAARALPREVIFVIDISGSMAGQSIVQAKEALLLALARLGPEDRFNVVAFSDTAYALFPPTRAADRRAVDEARRFVRRLEAEGGTEMAPALSLALRGEAPPGLVRQVVFLTDGAVGNEAQLFRIIHRDLGAARLFTIGIGAAPNGYFMTKAAEVGRGTYTFIGSESEVGERMGLLFRKLERPVLTDLAVAWPEGGVIETAVGREGGGGGAEMYPGLLPDLYAGEPVVFTARVARLDGPITVSGRLAGRPWRATLAPRDGRAADGVARLWAADKVEALLDGLHQGAERAEVRRRVVPLALAYGLVTRYTSLVAVDATPARPAGAPLHSRNLPTNLPDGWELDKVFGPAGERAAAPQRDAAAPVPGPALAAAFVQVSAAPRAGLGMPQGATPAPLHLTLAAALVALGLLLLGVRALWARRRAT